MTLGQNVKDKVTNVVAVIVFVYTAVRVGFDALVGKELNFGNIVAAIGLIVTAWFTGKPNK